MFSSWGNSWGFSWANSWSRTPPVSPPLKIYLYGTILNDTDMHGIAHTENVLLGVSGQERLLKGKAIQQ